MTRTIVRLITAAAVTTCLAGSPACSNDGDTAPTAALRDYGPAPEFSGIDAWLNSAPLMLASLRGKVVLVNFWTFDCINCVHTLPYVTSWYAKYKDQGLVIVGVHTPEFDYEHDRKKVEAALKRFGIAYPVAQDNGYATWNAYANRYWPADYLIDRDGRIALKHYGEGDYERIENAIRTLLARAH